MWHALLAVAGRVISYLLGPAAVKWVLGALFFGAFALLTDVLLGLFPAWFSPDSVGSSMNGFTPALWYFWDMFQVSDGLSLLLAAAVTKFLIRRLPVIG